MSVNVYPAPKPKELQVIDVQDFTTSGTWTKPAGAVKVMFELVGGGGGGGYYASGGARGGTGAAYSRGIVPADSIENNVTISVGAGGIGAVNSAGTSGGTSVVSLAVPGIRMQAGGGNGGANSATSATVDGGRSPSDIISSATTDPGRQFYNNLPTSLDGSLRTIVSQIQSFLWNGGAGTYPTPSVDSPMGGGAGASIGASGVAIRTLGGVATQGTQFLKAGDGGAQLTPGAVPGGGGGYSASGGNGQVRVTTYGYGA